MKTEPTRRVQIFMAGDIAEAKRAIRSYCYNFGCCVTVTPTDFIYTGGEEAGFVVGLVNYPRFPVETETELIDLAHSLIERLLSTCNQKSALIVGDNVTEWVTRDPPGASRDGR